MRLRRSIAAIATLVVCGCAAPHVVADRTTEWPARSVVRWTDPLKFDFTEAEMYAALRLVASDSVAREQAAAFAKANEPGMDWGIDDDGVLQLLSLGSESGRRRVARLRRGLHDATYQMWVDEDRRQHPAATDAETARRWRDHTAALEKDWATRLEKRRRALRDGER